MDRWLVWSIEGSYGVYQNKPKIGILPVEDQRGKCVKYDI
jgi:hypothetical protein